MDEFVWGITQSPRLEDDSCKDREISPKVAHMLAILLVNKKSDLLVAAAGRYIW